jgi:hypothetical protein
MKSALSLTLIASLLGSALPVAAQDRMESTAGPIARAVAREAVRLATEPAWSGIQQASGTAESDWSRVRKLAAGTEAVVTVKGSQPGQRYFVRADESDLTVLNLTDPTLPRAAMRVLPDMASNHPEYFTAQKGAFVDKEVRVGPDGVFVADRKVADLGQIVERIARNDVAEIRGPVRVRGSVHGAILGSLLLGSSFGLAFGTSASSAALGWSLLTGLTVVGGFLGYRVSSHKAEGVIYRAP